MFQAIKLAKKGDSKYVILKTTEENRSFRECTGEVLKNIRETYTNLSQEELGRRMGVSQTTIAGYEVGRQHIPLYALYRYCEVVGIEPQDAVRKLSEELNRRK